MIHIQNFENNLLVGLKQDFVSSLSCLIEDFKERLIVVYSTTRDFHDLGARDYLEKISRKKKFTSSAIMFEDIQTLKKWNENFKSLCQGTCIFMDEFRPEENRPGIKEAVCAIEKGCCVIAYVHGYDKEMALERLEKLYGKSLTVPLELIKFEAHTSLISH